jgi:hypothetical protein
VASKIPDEFLEVGCDYITATTKARASESSLDAFGRYCVTEQMAQGEKERPWRFSGYRGLLAGSASYGRRPDGAIVRLSSIVAAEHWPQVLHLATNVSRLDVQVTVKPPVEPHERLGAHLKELRMARRGKGKPLRVQYWGEAHGLTAVASGSRASARYLRVYDKGAQSELVHYQGCLRYEGEYHNDLAHALALSIDSSEDAQRSMRDEILAFAVTRSLALSWSQGSLPKAFASARYSLAMNQLLPAARVSKRLQWLHVNIRPAVRSLVESGKLREVLDALGLADVVQPRAMGHMVQQDNSTNWEEVLCHSFESH